MKKTVITDDALDSLLYELFERKSAALAETEAYWHDRVPERFRNAGRDALLMLSAPAARVRTPRRGLALGLAAVLAAGAVSAGALALSPSLRGRASALFGAAYTEPLREREPMDYVIPSPGEEFTVRDEAAGQAMVYRWYGAEHSMVLVEIARELPEDAAQTEDAEAVTVGGMWGSYCADTRSLLLHDGAVSILIQYWNGEREDILAYAEAFAAANE